MPHEDIALQLEQQTSTRCQWELNLIFCILSSYRTRSTRQTAWLPNWPYWRVACVCVALRSARYSSSCWVSRACYAYSTGSAVVIWSRRNECLSLREEGATCQDYQAERSSLDMVCVMWLSCDLCCVIQSCDFVMWLSCVIFSCDYVRWLC